MTKRVIFKDAVYGELTVVKSLGKSTGATKYECKCSCGNIVSVRGRNLTIGKTKSCGCMTSEYKRLANTEHGLSDTRTYHIWKGMKARCYNEKHIHYKYYGEKGIKVCKAWLNIEGFYKYFGDIKKPYTLERIKGDKNYCPSNCKLATPKEQANNRTNSVYLTYEGSKLTISEWADKTGLSYSVLSKRKYEGWSDKDILTKPIMGNKEVLYGDEILNIRQLSIATNIKYTTLMSRYNSGDRDARLWRAA